MMYPYRCLICGETSLFSKVPERCPFCGAASKRVVPSAEWKEYGKVNMCKRSYAACEKALYLELNNYAFYKCAAKKAENQVTKSIFLRLMKQEYEHAEVFSEAMGIEIPKISTIKCYDSDHRNMKASNKHETEAITFYTEVANRAPEPRIREIFEAISEVESEHLVMTNMFDQL